MTAYTQRLGDDVYTIFLLHGVIPRQRHAVRNYTRKHLELDYFTEFLRSLKRGGTPVSMPQIVAATRSGEPLPPKAFAITFDDGFVNNHSVAAPVLEEFGIPATFYVTSGFIENNDTSWVDLIEYAVEARDVLQLDLASIGVSGRFETREEKIALLNEIRRQVKNDPSIDPYDFAAEVWRQAEVTALEPDPQLDQKMTWEQVRQLSDHPLFTVGGHSHTHRILSFLEPAELEREIELSMQLVQAHVSGSVTHYSYPEGLANCYSERVIELLRRHGIECSPSAMDGVNRVGDDLFHLKRVMVV